jgi:hypothetical protein
MTEHFTQADAVAFARAVQIDLDHAVFQKDCPKWPEQGWIKLYTHTIPSQPAKDVNAGLVERNAFEAWLTTQYKPGSVQLAKDADGDYMHAYTMREWAGWKARAALAQPEQTRVVGCRIELVTAIHMLASNFENRLGRLDPYDRKIAEGDIAHAREIAAKWNRRGSAHPQASEPAPSTGEVGYGLYLEFNGELHLEYPVESSYDDCILRLQEYEGTVDMKSVPAISSQQG